jgi:hypothetical protein
LGSLFAELVAGELVGAADAACEGGVSGEAVADIDHLPLA